MLRLAPRSLWRGAPKVFNVRSRLRYLSGTKGGEEKGHQTEMKRERKTEGMTGTQLLKEETRWRANTKTAVLEEEAETGDERQTEKAEMSDERVETADVASGGKEDAKGVAKKPEMSDEEREKELFYAEMEKARRKMEKRGLDFIHLVDDYPIAEKQWNARKHSVYRYIFSKILPMAKEKETESLELREELMKAIFFKAKIRFFTHISRAMDEKGYTHLNQASLVYGAYAVLREVYGDDRAISVIRKVLNSQEANKITQRVMQIFMWLTTMIQGNEDIRQQNVFKAVSDDFGASFRTELFNRDNKLTLKVNRCLYSEMFNYEEVPELTSIFCKADLANFDGLSGKRKVELIQTIHEDAPSCLFVYDKSEHLREDNTAREDWEYDSSTKEAETIAGGEGHQKDSASLSAGESEKVEQETLEERKGDGQSRNDSQKQVM